MAFRLDRGPCSVPHCPKKHCINRNNTWWCENAHKWWLTEKESKIAESVVGNYYAAENDDLLQNVVLKFRLNSQLKTRFGTPGNRVPF